MNDHDTMARNRDIIRFVEVLNLLGKCKLSSAQSAVLRCLYGLDLDPIELAIFKRATWREKYIPVEHSELTVLAGRQSGKTSIIACIVAVFEAFQNHGVPPGQRAYVLIIAPALDQGLIAFRFVRQYILSSPVLSKYILKLRKSEVELKNGVVIACRACSCTAVRGVPVICAILDELAFWRHDESAANPEREVINSIRPAMATLSNTKIIKISSPYRKEGVLYSEFLHRDQLPYYVWQLSSAEMNPAISKEFLEKARAVDENAFRREHLAEFVDNNLAWITPELLAGCVKRGHREMPYVSNGTYVAAADPAFQSSDFGFAIVHRSGCGDFSVACALRWTGSKAVALDFEVVCQQIHEKLGQYGINRLIGDQHCFPILKQHFSRLGIFYREFPFGSGTRTSLFGNLRQLMAQGRITIVDDPELLRQLLSLEEVRAPNGNIDIRPAHSSKDDIAIAVAIAASELSESVSERYSPFILGGGEIVEQISYDPFGYQVGQVCEKFPVCWGPGSTCDCHER